MNITEEWLANNYPADMLAAALSRPAPANADVANIEPPALPSARRGRMNKTERRFAEGYLARLKDAGTIGDFAFEPLRLLIADPGEGTRRAYFTPDFLSWGGRDVLTAWEVKGHAREAYRVRIKVAAERHPYLRFIVVSREGKGWGFEFIGMGRKGD